MIRRSRSSGGVGLTTPKPSDPFGSTRVPSQDGAGVAPLFSGVGAAGPLLVGVRPGPVVGPRGGPRDAVVSAVGAGLVDGLVGGTVVGTPAPAVELLGPGRPAPLDPQPARTTSRTMTRSASSGPAGGTRTAAGPRLNPTPAVCITARWLRALASTAGGPAPSFAGSGRPAVSGPGAAGRRPRTGRTGPRT